MVARAVSVACADGPVVVAKAVPPAIAVVASSPIVQRVNVLLICVLRIGGSLFTGYSPMPRTAFTIFLHIRGGRTGGLLPPVGAGGGKVPWKAARRSRP